jgi:hypothetical protein
MGIGIALIAILGQVPASASPGRDTGNPLPDNLAAKVLQIDQPITLEDLARRHFPGPRRQERFMRWVVEANPELASLPGDVRRHPLPTGQSLLIPDGVPPIRPGDHQSGPLLIGNIVPQHPDRLSVGASGTDNGNPTETAGLVDQLAGLLERQASAQSLQDKQLSALEENLVDLRTNIIRLEEDDLQRESRRQTEQDEAQRQLAGHADRGWWRLLLAIAACGGLGTALLQIYRRRHPVRSNDVTDMTCATTMIDLDRPGPRRRSAVPLDIPLDIPLAASSYGSALQPVEAGTPAEPIDEAAAAIELVNIMTSMGLAQGAAQTLVDHIRAKPRQSLHHWLKLFELYRLNDDRDSFERTAQELREYYNVRPAAWVREPRRGESSAIEIYPHIRAQLIQRWRETDCAKFLRTLLTDNRNGTRAGFPLTVAEEILLLIAVKDETKT